MKKNIAIIIAIIILAIVVYAGMSQPQLSPSYQLDIGKSGKGTYVAPETSDHVTVKDNGDCFVNPRAPNELDCGTAIVMTCSDGWEQDGLEWIGSGDCEIIV